MSQRRRELQFQSHIIDSYKLYGGTGRKWATDKQAGMPDLILTMPDYGLHLVEVKHRPELGTKVPEIFNPLDRLQRKVLDEFAKGGAFVFCMVVGAGENTVMGSTLYAFKPWDPVVNMNSPKVPYHIEGKYNVRQLIKAMKGPN